MPVNVHPARVVRRAWSRQATAGRRLRSTEAGQAVVEFALILPLLAVIAMGILDLGRVFYTYEALANAAREGARYCALPADGVARPVVASPIGRVKGELSAGGVERVHVENADVAVNGVTPAVCPGSGARGSAVKVTVSAHFGLITPFMAKILNPDPTCAAPPPGDPILGKLKCSEIQDVKKQDGEKRGLRITASATMVAW